MQLSTNHIAVSDLDTPRRELLVWLVRPPEHGFIENTNRGESEPSDSNPRIHHSHLFYIFILFFIFKGRFSFVSPLCL